MTRNDEFLHHVLERMAFIRGLSARALFGGHGLYQDEAIFAIILDDMLYLKTDPSTRADFEAKGLAPFRYTARGKTVTMSYYEAPAEVFEDIDEMRHWVGKALQAALASGARKNDKARRRPDQA